jgi:hypothetical protein
MSGSTNGALPAQQHDNHCMGHVSFLRVGLLTLCTQLPSYCCAGTSWCTHRAAMCATTYRCSCVWQTMTSCCQVRAAAAGSMQQQQAEHSTNSS